MGLVGYEPRPDGELLLAAGVAGDAQLLEQITGDEDAPGLAGQAKSSASPMKRMPSPRSPESGYRRPVAHRGRRRASRDPAEARPGRRREAPTRVESRRNERREETSDSRSSNMRRVAISALASLVCTIWQSRFVASSSTRSDFDRPRGPASRMATGRSCLSTDAIQLVTEESRRPTLLPSHGGAA